jgi:hypothetical protein
MADIVTGTVSGQVDMTSLHKELADSRREQEVIGAAVRHEQAIGDGITVDAIKTAGWHNSDRTGTEADRVVAQDTAYFIAAQSQNFSTATALAALKSSQDASFQNTLAAIALAAAQNSGASALAASEGRAATALGQAVLGQQINADGNMTRALLNTLNTDALNRQLIERNADLVSERDRGLYWHGQHGQGQFAAVSSQLQAFQSQLQETRQGMVNFGTMAGVGQSSTSNNVR